MITKKELCKAVLMSKAHQLLGMEYPIDITKIPQSAIYTSSTIAVCMEYLDLLDCPTNKQYAATRGGIFSISMNENMEPVVITFRDILESMSV